MLSDAAQGKSLPVPRAACVLDAQHVTGHQLRRLNPDFLFFLSENATCIDTDCGLNPTMLGASEAAAAQNGREGHQSPQAVRESDL